MSTGSLCKCLQQLHLGQAGVGSRELSPPSPVRGGAWSSLPLPGMHVSRSRKQEQSGDGAPGALPRGAGVLSNTKQRLRLCAKHRPYERMRERSQSPQGVSSGKCWTLVAATPVFFLVSFKNLSSVGIVSPHEMIQRWEKSKEKCCRCRTPQPLVAGETVSLRAWRARFPAGLARGHPFRTHRFLTCDGQARDSPEAPPS